MQLFFNPFSVRPTPPVILNSSPDTNIILGNEGTSLNLICQSMGGYPQQKLEWFRGSVTNVNLLAGPLTVESGDLYNVTRTYTFNPRSTDDGVMFICQSSYSGDPRMEGTSYVTLELACEYAFKLYHTLIKTIDAKLRKIIFWLYNFIIMKLLPHLYGFYIFIH